MIDFHTHILPGIDDGADTVSESIKLLVEERRQGIDRVFLTPHFYADEDNPERFIQRRKVAYKKLAETISNDEKLRDYIPKMYLGAEVYYFPGISDCEELKKLSLAETGCVLVEPPMSVWTETMLDDIEAIGGNIGLVPVIAHVDRYCRMLKDYSLFCRLSGRRILNQVNASFFINEDSREFALRLLESNSIHLIGSDCHDTVRRAPNLGIARRVIEDSGYERALSSTDRRMHCLIQNIK